MSKKSRPEPVLPDNLGSLFDAHTHLTSVGEKTQASAEYYMDRASQAGIWGACTVGDDLKESQDAVDYAHAIPSLWAACAIHPTKADQLDHSTKEELSKLFADPRCVAIGETGLDKYWIERDETTPSLELQQDSFRWHIEQAMEFNKPVMIHNREADREVLAIMDEYPQCTQPVILHCFSSPVWMASEAIERGWILSFAGNVTFKRNDHLREAARMVPEDQFFVETDAPFMTPEPLRGLMNEPGYVGYTAQCLVQVRGVTVEQLGEQESQTVRRIYGI